jgi:Na+/H+ antiporter NhaC
MDQAHIHLLIVHLPLFGAFFGMLVLAHGLWHKSEQTSIAAFNVFIISAIGAAIAKFTGEGAEEAVEHIPGVLESAIELHEDAGFWAFVSMLVLGVGSVAAIFLTRTKSTFSITMTRIVLVLAAFCLVVVGRAAYLGGQIRHTEISGVVVDQSQSEEEDDD